MFYWRTILRLILLVSVGLGCAGRGDGPRRQVKPSDFHGSPATQPANKTPATADPPVPTAIAPPPEAPPEALGPGNGRSGEATAGGTFGGASGGGEAYTVDGMIGQVNGQPLYASKVLEREAEQLGALGRTQPPVIFRERARHLIQEVLWETITNALILGQAERDLSDREQAGVQHFVREHRKKLLSQMGEASEALAQQRSLEKTGKTIDQHVEEARQRLVVERYVQQKLLPQVNVTRKDIERYYRLHQAQYNPPPGRTVHMVRVSSSANAEKVDQMLAEGAPFLEVAAQRINVNAPEKAGLVVEHAVGEKVFGPETLNEAMLKLKAGQHSPRIELPNGQFAWVFVKSINQDEGKSLRDVQLEIAELLRRQQFRALERRYREKLYEEGSYTPVEQMAEALLQIAMSRYAQAGE